MCDLDENQLVGTSSSSSSSRVELNHRHSWKEKSSSNSIVGNPIPATKPIVVESNREDDNGECEDETDSSMSEEKVGNKSNPLFGDRDWMMDAEMDEGVVAIPGGLNNLGNTCYMASAIQMLTSLDSLMDLLLQQHYHKTLPDKDDNNKTLLQAFLEVVLRLRKGVTVSPVEVKQVLDLKTQLFSGYQQQDAHEFITTFLDMINEEVQKNMQAPKNIDAQHSNPVTNEMEATSGLLGGQTLSHDKHLEAYPMEVVESDDYLHRDNMQEQQVQLAQSKQAPLSSFSTLNLDEIGLLIHGTPTSNSNLSSFYTDLSTVVGPRCKLVGGRMNTNMDMRIESITQSSTLDHHAPQNHDESMSQALLTPEESQSPLTTNNAAGDLPQQQQKKQSPIESYFTTEVRVRLTCDSCKYTRTHEETFWHLSLELDQNYSSPSSVQDGLARFFAPEQRQLKCERCFCETATQTMQITKLPKALLLHFKRFIVQVSDDYSSVSYRKNTSPVTFDSHMMIRENSMDDEIPSSILSEFLAPDCVIPTNCPPSLSCCNGQPEQQQTTQHEYVLKSVVNHIGSSASCGHYTADALGPNSIWFRFNDSYVSKIKEAQATQGSAATAYMILYHLKS